MLKSEFLHMMQQDLETKCDSTLNQLLVVFEDVMKLLPEETEIDSTKTVEDCYKKMAEHAKKNAKEGCFCFGSSEVLEFVQKYFGFENVKTKTESKMIRLEDYI